MKRLAKPTAEAINALKEMRIQFNAATYNVISLSDICKIAGVQYIEGAEIEKKETIDRTDYLNIVAIKALAGYDEGYVRKYMDENYRVKDEKENGAGCL